MVTNCLTPHPIGRTSEVLSSQAANPNGPPSHGQRSSSNTYPAAVRSLTHRTHLPNTNQHNTHDPMTFHIISFCLCTVHTQCVPSQTNDGYRYWISRYLKKGTDYKFTYGKEMPLTPHPIGRTSEIFASQAANPNGSPSHGQRSYPNTHAAVGSPIHRTHLPNTNQHTSNERMTFHIISSSTVRAGPA